jgi:hypothetical protein
LKQVLVNKGGVAVVEVPAPLVMDGGVLVEVAYSLISTGTEISGLEDSGQSLVRKALEQPDRVQKVMEYLRRHGIQKTVSKVRARSTESLATGYSCSGVVVQVGRGVKDLQVGDRVACAGSGYANHAELVMTPRNLVVKVPDNVAYAKMAQAVNPYGDGQAAQRIVGNILGETVTPFDQGRGHKRSHVRT